MRSQRLGVFAINFWVDAGFSCSAYLMRRRTTAGSDSIKPEDVPTICPSPLCGERQGNLPHAPCTWHRSVICTVIHAWSLTLSFVRS